VVRHRRCCAIGGSKCGGGGQQTGIVWSRAVGAAIAVFLASRKHERVVKWTGLAWTGRSATRNRHSDGGTSSRSGSASCRSRAAKVDPDRAWADSHRAVGILLSGGFVFQPAAVYGMIGTIHIGSMAAEVMGNNG
jgi:hypothetical protein